MAKYCLMCDEITNCTENCKECLEEKAKEEEIKNENSNIECVG